MGRLALRSDRKSRGLNFWIFLFHFVAFSLRFLPQQKSTPKTVLLVAIRAFKEITVGQPTICSLTCSPHNIHPVQTPLLLSAWPTQQPLVTDQLRTQYLAKTKHFHFIRIWEEVWYLSHQCRRRLHILVDSRQENGQQRLFCDDKGHKTREFFPALCLTHPFWTATILSGNKLYTRGINLFLCVPRTYIVNLRRKSVHRVYVSDKKEDSYRYVSKRCHVIIGIASTKNQLS